MKKILFVLHNTSRTGAPFVLLYFLEWLRRNKPEIKLTVLALEGGSLSGKFKSYSDEYYELSSLELAEPTFFQIMKKKILKKLNWSQSQQHPRDIFIRTLAEREFDLIYANTILSIPVASKIKKLASISKLLVHVHELEMNIQLSLPGIKSYDEEIDHFITVSQLTKYNLINNYKISHDKISVVFAFAKLSSSRLSTLGKKNFVVGGAGTIEWRKGVDLFIQTANHIKIKYPDQNISFCWAGKGSKLERKKVEYDIQKSGLNNCITFSGSYDRPEETFNNFDVFLLTSREDPCPLVCIEAGMMGIPILCFEGATGTEEVLKNGGGEIVPYLDTSEMASSIMEYYTNREKLLRDGKIAKQLFSEFTPSNQAPKIYQAILSLD